MLQRISKPNLSLCAAVLLVAAGGAACVAAQQKRADKIVISEVPQAPENKQTNQATKSNEAKAISVKQVDFAGLQTVLKENVVAKRPLLVNFWATWCAPCREEFPELVKIDTEFRPKGLEFVTVSLDNLADKDGDVAAFLTEMRAEKMPAYLLKTADEDAAIAAIAPDWRGALPLTVLYGADGKAAYTKMGLIKPEILRAEIVKVLNSTAGESAAIRSFTVPPDDPHGFILTGGMGKKAIHQAKPSSPPIITNITITKNK